MAVNCFLLLYPLIVHVAVVLDSRWLELAALLLLAGNIFGPRLSLNNVWPWFALAVSVVASAVFVAIGEGRLFLYAAAVLTPMALMWLFAQTLLPGSKPLISRVAEAMRGPLPEPVRIYTRRVTQFWVVVLAGFAFTNLALAIWASPRVWSLFANFINYGVLVFVFVGEWLFRCWYMRDYESMTWIAYMRALVQLDLRKVLN